ncbi:Trk system potassium transporter TrkA [Chloroflexi bacterium TSY]|nr:Trk system potassium transporter TrkA [Chloroflexi bacterium TSY]
MRILIIGAGDIGFHLSKRLSGEHHDITVLESDPQKEQRAQEQLDAFVIRGSGSSFRDLERAGIKEMEIVTAVTNNDEVNLLACRLAKKAGVSLTLARVRNPEFTEPDFILSPTELGTDHIIHPEYVTAKAAMQLIHQTCATYAVEFEEGKIRVLGVRLDRYSSLLNTPLIDLNIYQDEHLRIVAIERNHQTLIPDGNTILAAGDQIFAVCDEAHVADFLALAGKRESTVRSVMILGGGLVGRFIAGHLPTHVNVKIIESDEDKAEQIACDLPHVLVIQGDGTDVDLLQNEGLSDMDAFVAVTGDDENNMISTLMAHHQKVPRCVALVNKVDYFSIMPKIGLDSVVSKQLLTVNAVQHLIQSEIADIASPPGMDAQLVEFIVGERSRITRRPLRKIDFPKGAIVGAVMRGDKVIIPHGDTQIFPGDKAVVFTLPEAMTRVERLF